MWPIATARHDFWWFRADDTQVPCGIYNDEARISKMLEDTTTIMKAANEIKRLAAGTHDAQAYAELIVFTAHMYQLEPDHTLG